MNKFLIIALIGLSVALACHSSCLCENEATPHTCTKCVDKNSTLNDVEDARFCPCNANYFS